MVIRLLDDPTGCVQPMVTDLRPLCLELWSTWGLESAHSVAHPCIPISSLLAHMVYLLPFLSYLAGSESVTALEAIGSSSSKNQTTQVTRIVNNALWIKELDADCCPRGVTSSL